MLTLCCRSAARGHCIVRHLLEMGWPTGRRQGVRSGMASCGASDLGAACRAPLAPDGCAGRRARARRRVLRIRSFCLSVNWPRSQIDANTKTTVTIGSGCK